jgi:hypothetical protein
VVSVGRRIYAELQLANRILESEGQAKKRHNRLALGPSEIGRRRHCNRRSSDEMTRVSQFQNYLNDRRQSRVAKAGRRVQQDVRNTTGGANGTWREAIANVIHQTLDK